MDSMSICGKDNTITVEYPVIDVRATGSTVTLSKCILSNISISASYPVIRSTGTKGDGTVSLGLLTIIDTSFSDIKRTSGYGSVFSFQTQENTHCLSNLSFTRCTSGNGGAIYATTSNSYELILPNCTFDSCTATSGYGGGLYVSMTKNAKVKLVGGELKNCQATKGGGIYLKIEGQPTELLLEGMTYTGNSGRTLYVESGDYINEENFPAFLMCDQKEEAYGKIGNDDEKSLVEIFGLCKEEGVDDIDDVIIDEECASGGDPLCIHAVTVGFVTDIFWQLSVRSSSPVMIIFYCFSPRNDHANLLLL